METGQRLAHYRIKDKLGQGGMGEVYRAEDTKLGRDVAVKVLPEVLATDPDRLVRFEREARSLAQLNHPNIGAIYGLEEAGAAGAAEPVRFLVLELVPGETLAERIDRGPLSVEQALGIAGQIADGMAEAHAAGILHRDLKPANVKITPDGKVKVLDFGLAKPFGPDTASGEASATQSPTLTSRGTQAGVLLGTAAYMAPEQARGQAVDRRADIWAFGVVLYEMLTGKRMFDGGTVSDTLASVLKDEPVWGELPAGTPPAARRLLRRALQKDPSRRLRDIADASLEIEEALEQPTGVDETPGAFSSAAGSRGSRLARLLPWALAAVVASAAVWFALRQPPADPLPVRRFAIPLPAGGQLAEPQISPDGTRVVYVHSGALWLRRLNRLEPVRLVEMGGVQNPFWSPDGTWVGFSTADQLFKVPADGGAAVSLTTEPARWGGGGGASWSANGHIYMADGNTGLYEVPERGGSRTMIVAPQPGLESDFHQPYALPGGRGVLFVVHRAGGENRQVGIDTIGLWTGGERREVLRMPGELLASPTYSPSGHILVTLNRDRPEVWAVPFDLERLETTGEPFLVATNAGYATASADGTLVYTRGGSLLARRQLLRLDLDGNVVEEIGESRTGVYRPAVSPDGTRVAVTYIAGGSWDVWVLDLARGTETRLTFGGSFIVCDGWLNEQEVVILEGFGSSDARALRMRADGTGEPRPLYEGYLYSARPTPDKRHLLLVEVDLEGSDIKWLALDPPGTDPTPLVVSPAQDLDPEPSPDGRYVAYTSASSGRLEVYLTSFPSGVGRWQVSVSGGSDPRWAPDGRRLYFVSGDTLQVVDVELDPAPRLGRPRELFRGWSPQQGIRVYDVLPDGTGLLLGKAAMVGEEGEEAAVIVVEQWLRESE